MTDTISPFLPRHHLLNAQRRLLADQPDLSSIASPAAQRLLFTSLLDYLASVPPLVAVDSLIDEDLARVVSTVLDDEPRDRIAARASPANSARTASTPSWSVRVLRSSLPSCTGEHTANTGAVE